MSSNLGSIRDGFGTGLREAAQSNDQIVALTTDLTESLRLQAFKASFPQRFIQMGVAEQNMMGVAAGLAIAGKIPVAAGYAVFSPGRNWEQLRASVCYSNLPVKVIGGHTGLNVGPDGATHQALEDIALTRVLPNMTVVVPCDEEQTRQATHAIIDHPGPCYLRLTRDKSPHVILKEDAFTIGRAQTLRDGRDVTIIACGPMVAEALTAANELATTQQLSIRVINLHTIKPLDVETLIEAAQTTGAVVTVEDHQVYGGMGSAVAECLAQHYPVPMEIRGVQDTFGESGPSAKLYEKYGLTKNDIMKAVQKVLGRKHA